MGRYRVGACIALLLVALPQLSGAGRGTPVHAQAASAATARATQFAAMPLHFEPNVGQAPAYVRYLAHGSGYSIALTERGAIVSLTRTASRPSGQLAGTGHATATLQRTSIRLSPVGGRQHGRLTAEHRLAGAVNYLIGADLHRWHTHVPTYERVIYHGVYPGIDLSFYGTAGRLEYDWIVHPHADVSAIGMSLGGSASPGLAASGTITLRTSMGTLTEARPRIYQRVHGHRVAIEGGYQSLGHGRYGFRAASYDRSRTLVIDPVILYSTFLGTYTSIAVFGVAVDGSGSAYVTGPASATDPFPTRNPLQSQPAGDDDAFIAKLNPSGTDLIYSTYLGGTGEDFGSSITVDSAGQAYVAGHTESPDFPGGQPNTIASGGFGVFVVRLNATGSALGYTYLLPNPGQAYTAGIVVDGAGDAYFAATFQAANSTDTMAAVSELNSSGLRIHTRELAGNGKVNTAGGVGLDAQGNVWVAVSTDSTNFSVPNGKFKTPSGHVDVYLARLTSNLLGTLYGTYWGGDNDDTANDLAVDSSGDVWVTGQTFSDHIPGAGALRDTLLGREDGFVFGLDPSGDQFTFSTMLGGTETGFEHLDGIATSASGDVYVIGTTDATDFPVQDPIYGPQQGMGDATVTEFLPDGRLAFSTYLGGQNLDEGQDIAVSSRGDMYVVGETYSTNFPVTAGAFQTESSSGAYVTRIGEPLPATPPPTATATSTGSPTSTATPTSTSTTVPNSTSTSTATAAPMDTPAPTASPTSTVTATPKPTATATRVPAPAAPRVSLKSARVRGHGGKLKLTVRTQPHASITLTLLVKSHGKVKYRKQKSGRAGANGRWSASLTIGFNPHAATRAALTVRVKTPGGTATRSKKVTILPRH